VIGDDRTSGDASLVVEEGFSWVDIYVDDYALGFLVTMYEKANRGDEQLGLWLSREGRDYRWHLRLDLLQYDRQDNP
jgi:hypothetical protein